MTIAKTWRATLLLAFVAVSAQAQESRGRVQGLVTDSTGAVLPGASVVLTNDHTAVATTRTSGRSGGYLFDYVDPGTYTLSTTLSGFRSAIQKNILVQTRGDVTVDVKLELGGLQEAVTVTESPVALQFNTASRDLTIESKMVQELPVASRNPFALALLDPSTVNRGGLDVQPYFHRASNEMDLGGGTKYRNDVILDGTPVTAGNKLGYTPPMDAVTEYTVQQNAVDAEFGHSAGGIAVITMKSGTNDFHGSAYFYGRSPGLNAFSDRVIGRHIENPYRNIGATLGMPILKNRLFLFTVLENIRNTATEARNYTMPTVRERQGDFSQSVNANGSPRVIYDPLTSRIVNGQLIRDPFPGNVIPRNRWDAVAAQILGSLWEPNNPGDDLTGFNNFKAQDAQTYHYLNFSSRLDWNLSDRWKAFARVSRMKTDQDAADYTEGRDPLNLRNTVGSKRNGWNIAADTVYTLNPSTTMNLRGSYYKAEDKREYPDLTVGEQGYANLWPSRWWESYAVDRPLIYNPSLVVDSAARAQFGVSNFWYQQPDGYSLHGRLSKYLAKHSLKAGTEVRWKRGEAARFDFTEFRFVARETADRWNSPSTTTGHPWASFLLGAMDPGNSWARYKRLQIANGEFYGFYVQDDFRATRNLTFNLGLRYEYQGGLWDPEYRLPQQLDLTDPIPGMQAAIDPRIPANVRNMMSQSAGQNSYLYNGAFSFTEEGSKRKTKAWTRNFMPRLGMAWRLGEKTVIRAGYGRFIVPTELANSERDTLGEIDLAAFSPQTSVLSAVNGVPQAYLGNPFPQGLTAPYGKSYGRFTNLGDAVSIDEYDQRTPVSDRLNLSLQRQLPFRIVADLTLLANFVSHDYFSKNLNQMDPRLRYTYGTEIDRAVPNPFFNYGTPETFPGALRRTSTVGTGQLLRPYPQYGDIIQTGTDLRKARYQSVQLRLQKPFSNGLSLLASYGYVKSKSQFYFDEQDEYDGVLTWFDFTVTQSGRSGAPQVVSDPKHRFSAAATWEVPVGRGRRYGSALSPALDSVLGGWQLSTIYSYTSGVPLLFGTMVAPASVEKLGNVGTGEYWFDVAGFARQPANTRRTNPWYYDGLNGPSFRNLDLGLTKGFKVKGRTRLRLRLDAFNALNQMNYGNPTVNIAASDFGRTSAQVGGYYGRQLQYSVRLEF